MPEKFLISTNPADGYKEIGRVPFTSADEVARAVAVARKSYPQWRAKTVSERGQYFQKFRELLKAHLSEIAELQTKEMGKPISESMGECKGILHWLKWHISHAEQFLKPVALDRGDTYELVLHREPYGVAGVIAPWNYPTYQFVLNTVQAMLAGNVAILKHSEECPLTARLLTSLFHEAGLPDGVFQSIYGDGTVGAELLKQEINFVSFTGSSKVGKQIYRAAAEKFIPTVLEMGGSSPAIVFDDVDLDATCPSIFSERFRNCGQICCALKRLIVHESVHDQIVSNLKEIISAQVVGNPLEENTTVGSLSAKRQLELLEAQVEDARSKGATIVVGGERPAGLDGAFYAPTLVTDIPDGCRILTEETFGPVLPVVRFSSTEEAIQIANDTPYGLSAFVYSKDIDRAMRVASELEAGQVSINGNPYFADRSPFGGYKESGIGRNDGEQGYYTVTQMKVISKPL